MGKVNIANYVIYDLANRIAGTKYPDLDNEVIDMVAEHWHKKHFVSGSQLSKHQHDNRLRQKFLL